MDKMDLDIGRILLVVLAGWSMMVGVHGMVCCMGLVEAGKVYSLLERVIVGDERCYSVVVVAV